MPVNRFDVKFSRPLADGKLWGDVGPYEELRGTMHFDIDPEHSANERITDVGLVADKLVNRTPPLPGHGRLTTYRSG
jgi:hypothetical protein